MKQKHKDEFIRDHGQAKWDLRNQYVNHGDRSPEAREAEKLYNRYSKGMVNEVYTVYGILENGVLKYIGSTGLDWRKRWTQHKANGRKLGKRSSALHYAMNTNSTNHKLFPEYTFTIFHTYTDKQTAKDMEEALIKAHNTHINGYNVRIGGGNGSKKYMTRPVSNPDDLQTR